MAFDGIVIHGLVRELEACVGARINKVHQPTNQDIVLQIRAQGQNYKLLLSANPTYPRVHFTQSSWQNPLEAPMFCMLLRKHCEGAIIDGIEQVEMERIIRIHVRQRDELGDISTKTIVIEIMGRHSNIILLDPATGLILDGIHHVTPAISSYRIVMPGNAYTPPPEQNKSNPLRATKESFIQELGSNENADDRRWDKKLVARYSGISPLLAKEIVFRSGLTDNDDVLAAAAKLWEPFGELMDRTSRGYFDPVIREEEATGKTYFSVTDLTHIEGAVSHFATVSECLEAYYGDKAERDTIKQRTNDLTKLLVNEKNKNEKKIEKLLETLEEANEADQTRISGELLTANLHLLAKGMDKIEVVNYYDEEQRPVVIPLDPLLTPSENLQRYFKKYTKLKNSLSIVQEQMKSAKEEIAYLDIVLQQLESASFGDIEEIREELIEQGYLRRRQKKQVRRKKSDKPALTCFTSSEGIQLYVGKNNTQNEYLTNRLAQANDTWLHTKDIPGSHVVIRASEFGDRTLHEAAQLAAFYSKAGESSQVPVDYTLIRHVRKPSGSKPGFVIYERQKTLFVTPDASLIKSLPSVYK